MGREIEPVLNEILTGGLAVFAAAFILAGFALGALVLGGVLTSSAQQNPTVSFDVVTTGNAYDPAEWERWMRERSVSVAYIQYGTADDRGLLQYLVKSRVWDMLYFDHAACIFKGQHD